jgi:choline-sulfatase
MKTIFGILTALLLTPALASAQDTASQLAAPSAQQAAKAAPRKPNILFIFSDDQTWNSLGCLPGSGVKTPNLDRLRNQGALFSHAYIQGSFSAAVCVASRTSLNTGAFLWRAAAFSNKGNSADDPNAPKGQATYQIPHRKPEAYWSQYMRQAGYETYFAGKWHVGGVRTKDIFDHSVHERGGMVAGGTKGVYDRAYIPGQPDAWSPADKSLGGYWTGGKHWSEVLADDSEAFLQQAKQSAKPFFMYLAFNAPHDPCQSPKEFVDMYPVDTIAVPQNFLPEYPHNEAAGTGRALRDEKRAPFPRTKYSIQVNRAEYYALITHMDVQIGRILDALKATGQADNTYIFFTSDNGLADGEHGFMGKQNMYDCSLRVPLLMVGPGVAAGQTVAAPVYMQDVMATSLEIAGVKKPAQVEFHSLLPLATGQTKKSAYDAIYGAYFGAQRMYRNDRHKMIIYPTINVVRLYDLIQDPLEMHDLAAGASRPVELMNSLFREYKKMQHPMADPIDVTAAFENFMNGLPAMSQTATAPNPLVIAHRGSSAQAPENTLPAFQLAWEQGADGIEADFQLTKDGHIVCFHDKDTKRLAGRPLAIADATLEELRQFDVGSIQPQAAERALRSWKSDKFKDVRIPTIAEVFATVPQGKKIFIEIKCGSEIIDPLLRELTSSGLTHDQVVVIGFDSGILKSLKARDPKWQTAWLCSFEKRANGKPRQAPARVIKTLRDIKALALMSGGGDADKDLLDNIRTAGIKHYVWTINDPKLAAAYRAQGADAIITDVPAEMRAALLAPTNHD